MKSNTRKSPNIKTTIEKNLERLHKVREVVSKDMFTSTASIRNTVGGSSRFYYQLKHNNIIIKENGYFNWNEKVPVTHKLATTLSVKTREDHMEGYKRVEKSTVPRKKVRKPRKSHKSRPENNKEFSLLWGLFKIKY